MRKDSVAASIGMEDRLQRESLPGPALGAAFDEGEIAGSTTAEKRLDLLNVGAGMIAEFRQDIRIAGSPERRNFR